jgi:hypothetical protein
MCNIRSKAKRLNEKENERAGVTSSTMRSVIACSVRLLHQFIVGEQYLLLGAQ